MDSPQQRFSKEAEFLDELYEPGGGLDSERVEIDMNLRRLRFEHTNQITYLTFLVTYVTLSYVHGVSQSVSQSVSFYQHHHQ
jgi:hypothetical protein